MEYVGEGGLADLRNRVFKRRGQTVLGSNGQAVITFDPPFTMTREPYLQLTPRTGVNDQIAVVNLVPGSFVLENDAYTKVTIRGAKLTGQLPQINTVSGLLGAVITGVNSVVAALTNFKLVNTDSASGVVVDWMVF